MQSEIARHIESLSYPDFVAFIGQDNCPPGGFSTIEQWIEWGRIGRDSHVLDLACSTGFSSRYVAGRTGCSGRGIDLSEPSVCRATEIAQGSGLGGQLSFVSGDACHTPFASGEFTHVLGGCNFGFINERATALSEMRRVLRPGGFLCTANFEYIEEPPVDLLQEVCGAVGFRPEPYWDSEFWANFFQAEFRLTRESFKPLQQGPAPALRREIEYFVEKVSPTLKNADPDTKQACIARLFRIREVLNRHRQYQGFRIAVWVPRD